MTAGAGECRCTVGYPCIGENERHRSDCPLTPAEKHAAARERALRREVSDELVKRAAASAARREQERLRAEAARKTAIDVAEIQAGAIVSAALMLRDEMKKERR